MSNWLIFSSLEVKIMYIFSLISLFTYIFLKYRVRGYTISIFNYGIIFYIFSIYISGFFQYDNKAWKALGHNSALKFIEKLNENSLINLLGFFIFFVSMIVFELKDKKIVLFNFTKRLKFMKKINFNAIRVINKIFILFMLCLIFFIFKKIPLFGNRLIAQELGYQTVYNIINRVLFFLTTIIIFRKNKKDKYLFTFNIILLILSGNRGPIITLLAYYFILKIYGMKRNNFQKQKKFIQMLFFLLLIGLMLEFVRGRGNSFEFLNKIKYGNTFSDIRDGAFVLYNLQIKIGSFLWGKTYIADLFSFIPAKYSTYRSIWGYSLFTTSTLAGWKNHFGLRGGLFLAPYFNFGYIGVASFGIAYAYLLSICEKFFYRIVIKEEESKEDTFKFILIIINIQNLSGALMIPAGFMTFYVVFIITIIIIIGANIIAPFIKEK